MTSNLVPQISAEDAKEYEESFKKGGVNGCLKYMQEKQDDWKDVPLNIGVIGNAGVGKSSFINTIRGLNGDDPGAATVGVNETTTVVTPYEHPKNPKLKFWDLPGVGTPTFPKASYFQQIDFDKYDFFIVLSANRFTETDQWLAKNITDGGKQLYFARTKIGSDIHNDKQAHPITHNPQTLIQSIRKNVEDNLNELNIKSRFFLIDNYERDRADLDFNLLEIHLFEDFPDIKREALILSLNAFSEVVVEKKVEILRKRIWKVAILSAVGAALPIPGFSIALDLGIIATEIQCYYTQLGLDPETIKKTARLMKVDEERLTSIITKAALPPYALFCTNQITQQIKNGLLPLICENAVGVVTEEVARCIPLIGAIGAAPISFYTTSKILNGMLDKFRNVALKVVIVYIEKTIKEELAPPLEANALTTPLT